MKAWQPLTLPNDNPLGLRHSLGAAILNETDILLFGGKDDEVWGDLDDLLVFSTVSNGVTRLKDKSH